MSMKLLRGLRLELDGARPEVVAFVGGGGKSSLLFRTAAEVVGAGKRVISTATTRLGVEQLTLAPATFTVAAGADLPWDAIARALDAHGHCLLAGDEIQFGTMQKGITSAQIDALLAASARLRLDALLVEADGSRRRPVKAPAAHEPPIPTQATLVVCAMGMDAIGKPITEPHVHRPEQIRSVLGLGDAPVRFSPQLTARLLADSAGGRKNAPPSARYVVALNKVEDAAARASARVVANLLADAGVETLITRAGLAEGDTVLERWGMCGALVLAAGEAKRFAAPKQAARVQQQSLIARAVQIAQESGAQHVAVITGAHEARAHAALADLPAAVLARTLVQHNPQWAAGQATSVRAGILNLPPSVNAVIILPVDQPFVDGALLRRLYAAWRAGAQMAAPLVDGALRGAPALFDRAHFAALLALAGDVGGRAVLQAQPAQVVAIETPRQSLFDIDTPADLAVARAMHNPPPQSASAIEPSAES